MMEKDAGQRFQTPTEVARALTPFFKKTSARSIAPGPADAPEAAPTAGLASAVSNEMVAPRVSAPGRATITGPGQDGTRPEDMWNSLIKLDDPEGMAAVESEPERKSFRWLATVAGLVAFAAALICAGFVYRSATDRGDLVIEADEPRMSVLVKQGGKQVASINPETTKHVTLSAGSYDLELSPENPEARLRLTTDSITVKRGETTVVSVRRAPPPRMITTPSPAATKMIVTTDDDPSPPPGAAVDADEMTPLDQGRPIAAPSLEPGRC